jgi:hypothetical protein
MAMIKKYQVFLSSTAEDLAEERDFVIKRMIGKELLFPIAMEHFLASDNTIDMLINYLRQTDLYVLIIGDNYGSSIGNKFAMHLLGNSLNDSFRQAFADSVGKELWNLTDLAQMSFTELEYCVAKALGIKCLVFIKTSTLQLIRSGTVDLNVVKFFNRYREQHAFMQWSNPENLSNSILDSLENAILTDGSLTGWVRELDVPIIATARQAGIQKLSLEGKIPPEDMEKNISNAREIKMIFTTGESFIKGNNNYLSKAVSIGCHIKVLCADPHSEFLTDVQKSEELKIGDRSAIHREYKNVLDELHNIYMKAKNEVSDLSILGTIEVASFGTLFRSTIAVCIREDGSKWGWLTVTLPPLKSRDTISFTFEKPEGVEGNHVLKGAEDHFDKIWEIAKENRSITTVSDTIIVRENGGSRANVFSKDDVKYWRERYSHAKINMRTHRRNHRVLIEVAAQHPLVNGEPGQEFRARLDRAYELYSEFLKKDYEAEIFVPGSVHLDEDGFPENESLSNAGAKYLLTKYNLSKEAIHGEDIIRQYQADRYWEGVYNTGDECYVAAQYFLSGNKSFGRLVTVCSPWQLMRKALFYINEGIIPDVYTVPTKEMYHNLIDELFEIVPYVLHTDHNYQSQNSREAKRTRVERMPDFRELREDFNLK